MEFNVAVILGTSRPGRKSEWVAKYILEKLEAHPNYKPVFVDPLELNMPFDGNDDEVKDPKYTKITADADSFIIVTPEYNHGYPGTLKRLLDSELKNYIHKPVSVVGVSDGMWGGVRVVHNLAPILREMGMVMTFTNTQFPKVDEVFDASGKMKPENEELYSKIIDTMLVENLWMTQTLKHGRDNIASKYHE